MTRKTNCNQQGVLFTGEVKVAPELESDVLRRIRQYLRARNIYHQRTNSGKIQTRDGHWVELCEEGTPDLLTIYRGIPQWIEAKRIGEKPRANQIVQAEAICRAGGRVQVAYDFMEVKACIEQIDKELDAICKHFGIKRFPSPSLYSILQQIYATVSSGDCAR